MTTTMKHFWSALLVLSVYSVDAQVAPDLIRFGSGEPVRAIRPSQFQIELPSVVDPLRDERPKRQNHAGYVRHPTFQVPYQQPVQFQQAAQVYIAQPNQNVIRQYPFQPALVFRQYVLPQQQQQQQQQPQYIPQAPQRQFVPQPQLQIPRQYVQPQPQIQLPAQPQYPRFDLRPQPARPVRPVYIVSTPAPVRPAAVRQYITERPQAAYGDELEDTNYLNARIPGPTAAPATQGYSERPPATTARPYVEPKTARPRVQPPKPKPYVVPTTRRPAPRPAVTTRKPVPIVVSTAAYIAPTTTTARPTTARRTTTTAAPTTTTRRTTTTTPIPTTTTPRTTPRTTPKRTTTPRPTTTTAEPTTEASYEEAVVAPEYDETFVGQYYYGRRGEGGNNTFPLPSCFYNPSGYVCCNLMLNELMTTSFEEVRTATNLCNVHRFATKLQKHSEKIFSTQFETIVSYEDFSQKIHFRKDLVCKVFIEGRYILAYATPEDVERDKIIPPVPSRDIQKDSVVLKEEVKGKIRQIEREL